MSVHIKRGTGALPVYVQIGEALRRDIQNFYKAGDLLPSEGELATRYNVNRHTLRRAMDELVSEGLVDRQHGKGVFVLAPSINYHIGPRTCFTENLETLGISTECRVIRKQLIPAQGGVADRLQLTPGSDVIFLETLRTVKARPFCVISHFLPLTICPQIIESYDAGSLHDFLARCCNRVVRRSESLISAVLPEVDDARLLNMPRHMPVLRVKSVNVDAHDGQPVEYVVTRFRGDGAQLSVQP